jgi:hypothetical protein
MASGLEPAGDVLVSTDVVELLEDIPGVDVRVKGKRITIQIVAADGRVIAEQRRFIPEPGP